MTSFRRPSGRARFMSYAKRPSPGRKNGAPIIMTYADRAGNAGSPYAFSVDETARDGKAKSNPLDIRLGGFGLKPKPTTPIV